MNLKTPFPYFGNKSKIAKDVWSWLGQPRTYIEPFAGSLAVLLGRPDVNQDVKCLEIVNDADGMVSNFWRAVQTDPSKVAWWADWPINEIDKHARHKWLIARRGELQQALDDDPLYFDAQAAGWWAWGIAQHIGGGWCGRFSRSKPKPAGNGINAERYINCKEDYLAALAERLRHVRIYCGDWSRVLTPAMLNAKSGPVAVFLDPPYGIEAGRDNTIYACESTTVAGQVRAWCLDNANRPGLTIALCGYAGEHEALEDAGFIAHAWEGQNGFAKKGNQNRKKERVWVSTKLK